MPHPAKLVVAIGLAVAATLVNADINVGVTVSATGPAASLGIPEKNTIALMPQTIGGQRRVVAAFAEAIVAIRPELAAVRLQKPLAMLLFGMMNWMFTWLKPRGELSHADMAPVVADLFFGGLGAVRAPGMPSLPLSNMHNGDTACLTPSSSSSRSASPPLPR